MQTTLEKEFSLVGTGLHTGRPVRLNAMPAPAGHGVVFVRSDITDRDNAIAARFDAVNDTQLCTRIANEAGVEVSTIEHLMAALAGCGVHNARIEVDGPEVPIMDGSSVRFVREILMAGVVGLEAPVPVLRVLQPVKVVDGLAEAELLPSDSFEIDFRIEFDDAAIGTQVHRLDMHNGSFARELSDCRTFCRQADVDYMRRIGLALGGNMENAVVVDGGDVLNPEGFRRADECVRHKMLDAMGDLALAGAPVLGRYRGIRAGHRMTNLLLRKLFATPGAFEFIEADKTLAARLPGVGVSISDLDVAV